jgi:Putative transposase of IS4/5 family (DUF4096)
LSHLERLRNGISKYISDSATTCELRYDDHGYRLAHAATRENAARNSSARLFERRLEPLQQLVESDESVVVPLRVADSQRIARCGSPSTADRRSLHYPSDMSDAEWALVAPMIPPARRGWRRRSIDEREVLNAIFYVHESILRGSAPRRQSGPN